jgi:5-dehydro-2-deoxygluconokinase
VEPVIWKVEGLDRHEDAVAVAATAVRRGRQARCIVLGRHAPRDKLDHARNGALASAAEPEYR